MANLSSSDKNSPQRQRLHHPLDVAEERLRSMSFTLGAGPLRAFANHPCSCPGVYRHD